MPRVIRALIATAFSFAILIPDVSAQQAQDPTNPPPPQTLTKEQRKEQKQKARKTLKELDSQYRQWLNEDVIYIISPSERTAFLQYDTNEEREQFIEQFWLRRSSNPDLPDNDFKEEHYRRIAYANEHYASGIPGWKTDRGRMYIMWGPADEIDSHPSGGTYDRPMEEGGGSTTTYPWETWRWRYLEGIGENIILEFVDPSGSGEYHLTMDPSEKDALLHVPGAGLSLLESMGMASKTDRFTRSDGTNLPTAMGGTPASMDEFNRLELYAKVQKPPEVKFKDLEAIVTARIVRDQLAVSKEIREWLRDFGEQRLAEQRGRRQADQRQLVGILDGIVLLIALRIVAYEPLALAVGLLHCDLGDQDFNGHRLRRAVELGVTLIDTADAYGPETDELLIAEALHPYPKGLVIATKGGLTRQGPNKWAPVGRAEYLRECVEMSLRRLRLERIDLYRSRWPAGGGP